MLHILIQMPECVIRKRGDTIRSPVAESMAAIRFRRITDNNREFEPARHAAKCWLRSGGLFGERIPEPLEILPCDTIDCCGADSFKYGHEF